MSQRFDELLQGYKNNTLSPNELQELLLLLDSHETSLHNAIWNDLQQHAFAGMTTAPQRDQLFNRILEKSRSQRRPRVLLLQRRAAAAAILLAIGIGTYVWVNHIHNNELASVQPGAGNKQDVQPGGNKALLTLADGRTIVLDSAGNGVLAKQGNAKVLKTSDGVLQYEPAIGNRQSAISKGQPFDSAQGSTVYNKLSTPRGGQYQLVLPDGTKVWLNAASSITYPTAFAVNERRVSISGEAYFEVAKDPAKPFHVTTAPGEGKRREAEITVLGTHFNVNAYDDENAIAATLLEGKVRVNTRSMVNGEWSMDQQNSAVLAPGEQAVMKDGRNAGLIRVRPADIDQVVSWKNGQFFYSNTDIATIMRQLARWYDVEVEYKTHPADKYTVSLSRNVPVSKLLQFLELSGGVKFSIEGRKVIVE